MSVSAELKALEERVTQRLQELRPVLEELKELEAVAQRLGLQVGEAAGQAAQRATDIVDRARAAADSDGPGASRKRKPSAPAARTAERGASKATGTNKRPRTARKPSSKLTGTAGRGERTEQVRQVIGQQPGITVREIATQLKVDPTGLYRVVRTLEQQGVITKDGTKLTLAAGVAA